MIRTGLPLLVCLALSMPVAGQSTCPGYNVSKSASPQTAHDVKEHVSGDHEATMLPYYSCTYTAQPNTSQCASECTATLGTSGYTTYEGGTLQSLRKHSEGDATVEGNATGNGPSIQCGTQLASAIRSCSTLLLSCDITVSISGSFNGIGGSVSFTASPLWSKTLPYTNTCASRSSSSSQSCPQATSAPPTLSLPASYVWVWNTSTCSWVEAPCNSPQANYGSGYPTCGQSPIVIDTSGEGFKLTSVSDGVMFDFYGTGSPIQIAWTAPGSKNGWLALPESDGSIRSARDLFGNLTAQPVVSDHETNGFAALSVWDAPSNGGNNNGKIDPGDAAFGKFRVWVDSNHNGSVDSGELHTLDELGIASIDLKYEITPQTDQYGNQFRYKGHLKPANNRDATDRKLYDVILK